MSTSSVALLGLSVVYLAAVLFALLSALSPVANHPGVALILLTVPWSALLLPLLDWIAPHAPQWVAGGSLCFGALINVGMIWILFHWLGNGRKAAP